MERDLRSTACRWGQTAVMGAGPEQTQAAGTPQDTEVDTAPPLVTLMQPHGASSVPSALPLSLQPWSPFPSSASLSLLTLVIPVHPGPWLVLIPRAQSHAPWP